MGEHLTKKQIWENLEKETDKALDNIKGQFVIAKYSTASDYTLSEYNLSVFKLAELQIEKRKGKSEKEQKELEERIKQALEEK